ncbi:ATPase [Bradyrhizobium sp. SSBR45G]|uniref:SRPBCC family protein n=1 Tax=unclassified Bradyrhizobium TaxID=2631580 RepID=UPI002342B008|nr:MULTISPECIES: SRPBCC family protein [unclassified Bradyrhizobium]GLH77879.1 ATPase [Bradyrhizobium sp. SSBR45G]GLH85500.1 ATPase [Bradyrhizobium sp. SSBR45R]
MSERVVIAPVEKQVLVRAPIDHAFAVFTSGLTRWWPHTHGVGGKPIARVLLEPKLGGRWLEVAEDGTQTVVATITLWEPPQRFVMLWQVDARWKPDAAMRSEVDVRFFAEGEEATRVELVHHKFETMGAEAGASMRRDVDGGWPGLLQRFTAEAERGPSSS